METAPPLGLIARVFGWFIDVFRMPTRVRAIAEVAAAERDVRPGCPACGTGRVGVSERRNNASGRPMTFGRCGDCKSVWVMSDSGDRVFRMSNISMEI